MSVGKLLPSSTSSKKISSKSCSQISGAETVLSVLVLILILQ